MIVQPDFTRHYKAKKLAAMAGKNSLLSLINLWGHCQISRSWEFRGLKRDDLASICEWDSEISCEKALIACGFIEKIGGGGYRVRNWDEHNKNLIANWKRNPSGKPKGDSESDPTGTPRAPHDTPDQIRSDPTKPEEQNQTKPDPIQPNPSGPPTSVSSSPPPDGLDGGVSGVNGLVDGWMGRITQQHIPNGGPSLEAALEFGQDRHSEIWDHAETWVRAWYKTMSEAHWLDRKSQPLADWKKHLISYCDVAWRKIGDKPKRKGSYVPNI